MTTESLPEKPQTQPSRFQLKPFLIGGLICILFGVIDTVTLNWAQAGSWNFFNVGLVFTVFITQAFVLSAYTGFQLRRSKSMLPGWIFFFVWSLLLTNTILALLIFSANYDRVLQLALTFAFLSAQLGFVIIWGVLGTYDWRKRLPVFLLAAALAAYPYWMPMPYREGWNIILAFYAISAFVSCGILRFFGFQITSIVFGEQKDDGDLAKRQFGIRNVLIWTSIVAVCVGFGRVVPWELVWSRMWAEQVRFALLGGLLMSVSTISTCWAALGGANKLWVRLPLLFLALLGIAYGLYQGEIISYNIGGTVRGAPVSWVFSPVVGWSSIARINHLTVFVGWVCWCGLNGLFLLGLLQSLGFAGCRLVRGKSVPQFLAGKA